MSITTLYGLAIPDGSRRDFEAILVIIDHFSKYATFIPTTKQCSVEMTTQLLFKHVVKLWGVPTSIVSDKDGILAPFCKLKAKELGPAVRRSPILFQCSDKFRIGRSSFEIISGRQPILPHLVDHPYVWKNPQALNFTKEWKQTNDIARAYLEKASKRMKKWVDKKRQPLEFRAGDQEVRRTSRSAKKVGNASYRVALPTWMKIYPVIHVSNLKPYHQNTEDLQQNVVICLIIDLSQKEDKDVEEILAERVRRGRRPTRRIHEYLVKWKNLPVEETSWKRVKDLEA
ncbi:reverse transcriptase [Cucumis melo var. makuwa]|uniref:Reverse transcriptase n=1 Tax=Cucumis melo var. makuwa TaxID=1194695 RepID=A0A5D3BC52_CUCMM|nr:reverse transcriptase [Cucumis melo var. makuwa]